MVLELPDDSFVAQVNQTLKSFVEKPEVVAQLTERLVLVESW